MHVKRFEQIVKEIKLKIWVYNLIRVVFVDGKGLNYHIDPDIATNIKFLFMKLVCSQLTLEPAKFD